MMSGKKLYLLQDLYFFSKKTAVEFLQEFIFFTSKG